MKIKPVILILDDEFSGRMSEVLKREIEAMGEHYAVVLKRNQYDNRLKKFLDYEKIVSLFSGKKAKQVEIQKIEKNEKRIRRNRLFNAVLRFKPRSIVCLSPHSHTLSIEAKRKTGFETPIIAVMPSFTLDKDFLDVSAETFLVENRAVKAQIEKEGVPPRAVAALGLPVDNVPFAEDKAKLKRDIGLGTQKTVFLNYDGKKTAEMFDMLLDQGAYINVIAYCPSAEVTAVLKKIAKLKGQENVVIFDKVKDIDEYLSVSDLVVTPHNIEFILKSFSLMLPVVVLPTRGAKAAADIKFLEEENMIYNAKNYLDVINGIYKIIQTNFCEDIKEKLNERKVEGHLDNIVYFIVERGLPTEKEVD